MMSSDHDLLRSYVTGRHQAFRDLVERHAGMIYGAAWRSTGDRTIAEEVVQDVFCLLARKSTALLGHPSVAGWLHRTAVNTARSRRRDHVHHERKLARFATESPVPAPDAAPTVEYGEIDSAIDRLPSEERAAVVLRFFQEQDYAEISRQLGVSEVAARKRVSRGLRRLERLLGPAGAAAFTPTGLALTVPARLIESVAAAATLTAPAPGLLSTVLFMSTKSNITAAATLLLTGGLAWLSADLMSKNRDLRDQLSAYQTAARSAELPLGGGGAGLNSSPAVDARMAELQSALEDEREKRLAAERDAAAVRGQVAGLEDEVVVTYGKVTQIGETLGSLFTEALVLVELEKQGELATPENENRFVKFLEKASSISGLSKEIIGFEDAPDEGSRFAASAYGSAFGLNEAAQDKVAAFLARRLSEAGTKKLTLANLPDRGSAGFLPWLEQRWAFFDEGRAQLRELIPADKQALFDQSVEKGGYGFKNISLKGMPLMFSLGGDPR
jgi:RNA polymerase sigma factor (sigma-70 family)